MTSIGSCDAVQMSYAEEDKVIQALVAQRANEPIDERLAVGGTPRGANDLGPLMGHGLVKAVWELAVPSCWTNRTRRPESRACFTKLLAWAVTQLSSGYRVAGEKTTRRVSMCRKTRMKASRRPFVVKIC